MLMDTPKKRLNINFLTHKIAHRGLHSDTVIENSLESFRLAVEKDYAIEIDVHLTRDGELAVVHDSDLERVTGKSGIVEELTTAELKQYTLKDGQHIPLMKEVLDLVNGRVPLLIELKFRRSFDYSEADKVISLLEDYPRKDMIALQSFHPFAVRYLKGITSEYSVGYLCSYDLLEKHKIINWLLKTLKLYRYMHADFISYDINYLPNRYVSSRQRRGEQVLAWTVDSPEKEFLASFAADNIIFENILPESGLGFIAGRRAKS